MLEKSYGLKFFLKSPKRKGDMTRYVHVRVTVDGVPKDASTKRKWDVRRWDQEAERAMGFKEDAKTLNFFLDSLVSNVNRFRTESINQGVPITANLIIDFINGNHHSRAKVLEEFQIHNDELFALIGKDYTKSTYDRYVTARSHVQEFISFKYKREDLEFRELNYQFVKDYAFYLKAVRNCSNNTALKYISNFKKIVLIAIAKKYIPGDPFKMFKGKKTKIKKKPLTKAELQALETKEFTTERLSLVRDIFVFQCYTGLSYIDVRQLKKDKIKQGDDGRLWIMSDRQKTKSDTDIPLLPKALEIMEKYREDPVCIKKNLVLPVTTNQKMNEYLKEIQALCEINLNLTTHRARRTFASTVTLNNGVPIHVVKEMMGHSSVKQTEEYALTEQETVSKEMKELQGKLFKEKTYDGDVQSIDILIDNFEKDLKELKNNYPGTNANVQKKLIVLKRDLENLKNAGRQNSC